MLVSSGLASSAFSIEESKTAMESQHGYDMVIITPAKFKNQIQPLIDHKNHHDVKTFLKSTEEIYREHPGRDKAEQIKYYIKNAIETFNLKYVLLIGGKTYLGFKWNVPSRYSQLDDGNGYSEFLSDLYFADIYKENGEFEDWDSNGNGVFAEWGTLGDNLDLKPDIALGRLPCRTENEVKTVVDKIINYEENTYGQSWFNRMVVVGGDTFPTYEGYEGESTCDISANFMDRFEIDKLYTSTGNLTSPNDIVNSFNKGCGFLLTRGRGGQDRIRMVEPEGNEFIAFHIDHISNLNNFNMYPVCILNECIHGKFDVGIFNYFKYLLDIKNYYRPDCILECIAWRLIREENAGAIAVLTNTNICYGAIGDDDDNGILDDAETFGGFLGVEFFRLYVQENIDIIGDLHLNAISTYVENFPVHTIDSHSKSVQEFILLGDPSLKIGGYQ